MSWSRPFESPEAVAAALHQAFPACGFTCTSLAALDAHMEQFPVDDHTHEEL